MTEQVEKFRPHKRIIARTITIVPILGLYIAGWFWQPPPGGILNSVSFIITCFVIGFSTVILFSMVIVPWICDNW